MISHLCTFRAREDFYHRTVLNRLNEECDYLFTDDDGEQCKKLAKWEKFESLQNNIYSLEIKFKNLLEKNNSDHLNDKFHKFFNSRSIKKNIYSSIDEDKVLGDTRARFKFLKKFLNRFFAFSGGGFYGYNLMQQIVWKSKLGMHILIKVVTLPIILMFIPLILLNGIANIITYHLHSRQRDRFEMVKNLDSKLEILEQTSKALFFLVTLLSAEYKCPSSATINLNASSESQSNFLLADENIFPEKKIDSILFFKSNHKKINSNEKKDSLPSEITFSKV